MEEKIEKLKQQKIKTEFLLDSLQQTETLEGQIAIALHKFDCSFNHEDQCGWNHEYRYDEHDWDGNTHHDYLMQARRMIIDRKI